MFTFTGLPKLEIVKKINRMCNEVENSNDYSVLTISLKREVSYKEEKWFEINNINSVINWRKLQLISTETDYLILISMSRVLTESAFGLINYHLNLISLI